MRDAPVLPAIDLPALGGNGAALAPALTLPPLPDDLHAPDFGHDASEVVVQAPIPGGDHDEELDAGEGPRGQSLQELSEVTLAQAMGLGSVVEGLALSEIGGPAFSLAPRADRSHGRAR